MKALRVAIPLLLLPLNAAAQPRRPRPAPTAETAPPEATAIRRNTASQETNFGTIPPERNLAPGDVGTTGEAITRGPQGELRGPSDAPDAIDMSRPIGPGDVARLVRTRDARFRACYEQGRAARPTLTGRINMRFVVQRDGSLANVDVAGLPEAPQVAPCIRAELVTLRLPRPEAGTLTFTTGINFSPPPAAPPRRGRGRPAPTPPRH